MFPHLYAMKETNHLSSEEMGGIIGTSRQTYEYKAQRGNFTPFECKALCRYFHKSFGYLFATADEIDRIDEPVAYMLGSGNRPRCTVCVEKGGKSRDIYTGAANQAGAGDCDASDDRACTGDHAREEGCPGADERATESKQEAG